jgi:hypothetical protein
MRSFRRSGSWVLACLLFAAVSSPLAAGEHVIGIGANYFRTIDELEDSDFEIEDDGLSTVASYQYRPQGLVAFEIDLEYFEKGFGGSTEAAYSPQAYLVLGRGWFAALGVGTTYSDGFEDEISDPFYAAKAGFNLGLLPKLALEIAGQYRFDAFSELDDADTDTIFLGAMLRFSL